MSYMTITCGKCGHEADAEAWTRRELSGDLPPGEFQCPKCGYSFARRHGPAKVYASGFVMPGPVTLEPVGARL